MTDSISSITRRITGQHIARAPETGSGSGSSSVVANQSAGVDGASSFARVEGVNGAKATVESKIAGAINRVAQIMTQELVNDGEASTFSAPGVTALLMFAANGTSPGAERDGYLKSLGLDGLSIEQVNEGAAALASRLASLDEGVSVNFANIAFSNTGKSGGFTEGFVKNASGERNTVIDKPLQTPEELKSESDAMNAIIAKATKGMITDFMNPGKLSEIVWALISAIGFEGIFTNPFVDAKELTEDPGYKKRLGEESGFAESLRETAKQYLRKGQELPSDEQLAEREWRKDASIYLELGKFERVQGEYQEIIPRLQAALAEANGRMKLNQGGMKVIDNARFTAVMFPYGKNEGASIVAMLPKGNLTPKQLLADVGSPQLAAAFANAEPRAGDADDKFQLAAFETKFKPSGFLACLSKIAKLKFSNLAKGGAAEPDSAELEAKIKLTARKTTAGQVASMAVTESVSMPPPPVQINFDKPYAYAIVTKDDFLPLWQGTQTV